MYVCTTLSSVRAKYHSSVAPTGRIVTAHQPHFLPWTGYLSRIALADVFVVMDNLQYTHYSYINRNRVMGSQGPLWLTVPIRHAETAHAITEVEIDAQRAGWRRKHLRSIEQNYRHGAGFDAFFPELTRVYDKEHTSLFALDMDMLGLLLEYLEVRTEVVIASVRGIGGRKQDDMFVSMLDATGSDGLLLGLGASTRYANASALREQGYRVLYQRFDHPRCPQRREPFVPGLSAVDLLLTVPRGAAIRAVKEASSTALEPIRTADTGESA